MDLYQHVQRYSESYCSGSAATVPVPLEAAAATSEAGVAPYFFKALANATGPACFGTATDCGTVKPVFVSTRGAIGFAEAKEATAKAAMERVKTDMLKERIRSGSKRVTGEAANHSLRGREPSRRGPGESLYLGMHRACSTTLCTSTSFPHDEHDVQRQHRQRSAVMITHFVLEVPYLL